MSVQGLNDYIDTLCSTLTDINVSAQIAPLLTEIIGDYDSNTHYITLTATRQDGGTDTDIVDLTPLWDKDVASVTFSVISNTSSATTLRLRANFNDGSSVYDDTTINWDFATIGSVVALSGTVAALSATVGVVQAQVSTLTGAVAVLQGEMTAVQGQVSDLQSDVSGLQSDVSGLQSDVSGLQLDVSGLQSDVSSLTTKANRSYYQSSYNSATNILTFTKNNGNTDTVTIVDSQWDENVLGIWYEAGFVGIGTSTQAKRLDVWGEAQFMNGSVGIGTTIANYPLQVEGAVSATSFIGDGGNLTNVKQFIQFSPTGLASAQNVAIGKTTAPSYTLDVNGSGYFAGSLNVIGTTNLAGNVGIAKTTAPTYPVDIGGYTYIDNALTVTGAGTFNGLTVNNNLTELKSCANVTITGSTFPAYLNITGGSKEQLRFASTSFIERTAATTTINMNYNTTIPYVFMKGRLGIGATNATYNSASLFSVEGGIAIGSSYTGVAAPTNGIIAEGSVGIGTTLPTQKLEVIGQVKATSFVGDGSGLTNLPIGSWTASGNNIYYNLGNVGIGTTHPTVALHVEGDIFSTSLVGMVCYFARSTAPNGWLKCNGTAWSRTTYKALFDAIGTTFGEGDGSTTFEVPDLRAEFIRGWDDGRGIDPTTYSEVAATSSGSATITALSLNGEIGEGWLITSSVANVIPANTYVLSIGATGTTVTMTKTALLTNSSQTITFTRVFGSGEQDCVQDHTHGLGTGSSFQGGGSATAVDGSGTNRYTGGVRNGVGYRSYTETRPRNVALLACIKY